MGLLFCVGKEDQLNGFRLGADDYIEKPVDPELLVAKIRSLFTRTYGVLAEKDYLYSGSIMIDKSARKVYKNDIPIISGQALAGSSFSGYRGRCF